MEGWETGREASEGEPSACTGMPGVSHILTCRERVAQLLPVEFQPSSNGLLSIRAAWAVISRPDTSSNCFQLKVRKKVCNNPTTTTTTPLPLNSQVPKGEYHI